MTDKKSKIVSLLDELSNSIKGAVDIHDFDYNLTNDIEEISSGEPWKELRLTGWKKLKLEIRWLSPDTETVLEKK